MLTVIVAAGAFFLGLGLGAGAVIQQVRAGRLVVCGRIYWCKDIGPVAR